MADKKRRKKGDLPPGVKGPNQPPHNNLRHAHPRVNPDSRSSAPASRS